MKVIGARCIVKEIKLSEKTTGGVIIPGREKQQTNKGVVVTVGDGAILENGTRVPMDVKIGDTVIYAAFAGTPIVTGSNTKDDVFMILNERDILLVLEKDESLNLGK